MSVLNIKPKDQCKYDILSLGEIMLRLDPGDSRIHTTREFKIWEGGGEYNVARGLKRCFGQRAAVVTAIPDCPETNCTASNKPRIKASNFFIVSPQFHISTIYCLTWFCKDFLIGF